VSPILGPTRLISFLCTAGSIVTRFILAVGSVMFGTRSCCTVWELFFAFFLFPAPQQPEVLLLSFARLSPPIFSDTRCGSIQTLNHITSSTSHQSIHRFQPCSVIRFFRNLFYYLNVADDSLAIEYKNRTRSYDRIGSSPCPPLPHHTIVSGQMVDPYLLQAPGRQSPGFPFIVTFPACSSMLSPFLLKEHSECHGYGTGVARLR